MSFTEIVDLCSDDEHGEVDVKAVKLEVDFAGGAVEQKEYLKAQLAQYLRSKTQSRKQEPEDKRDSLTASHSSISMLEQGQSPVDDTDLSSSSPLCPAPICRQFWNAGNYEDGLGSKIALQKGGKNYLHVHPMFLHSNATSHKWAFGAVAELLDNAVDEIQNGATFVIVDKTSNPRDGSPSLLIQDDGGGMDPEAMRRCMSFGFSDKKSSSAIGQYGNGFKTSSMRLGADVIVFSRHQNNRILTQSIGLLSYTFLSRTGHDRIVVPMVDYQINTSTGAVEKLQRYGAKYFMSNMSMLLQWSPFSSEAELLKQFDDIGSHGTKVIIYNLWLNDDKNLELDFETDPEDIRIGGEIKKVLYEQHIANRYHYSLRVYLSILYLQVPKSFRIILRGKVVEHHSIASDLKFTECILYKPHSGGSVEGSVITSIGFLKEAPNINVHGFNVYHKNRLILPFWQVVSYSDSRGRGVVGVLEANFIEPTHNKQDFERTSLFQKLEGRLKEMTWEYWDCHCWEIGYQVRKKGPSLAPPVSSHYNSNSATEQPVMFNQMSAAVGRRKLTPVGGALLYPTANVHSMPISHKRSEPGLHMKRKEHSDLREHEKVKNKKHAGQMACIVSGKQVQPASTTVNQLKDQETVTLLVKNKKLKETCWEHEKREKELYLKATKLRNEVGDVNRECAQLLAELQALDPLKKERNVNI